jgi:alpha-beta hydrolase superfamily lysophospholipase
LLADHDGWDTVVDDLAAVTAAARGEQPGLPVVLFGHSMGSFLSRAYAASTPARRVTGMPSPGSCCPARPATPARSVSSARVSLLQARLRGRRHTSGLMDKLSFGQYNAAFAESHGLRLAVAGPGRGRQVRR